MNEKRVPMSLNEYQDKAMSTCMETSNCEAYMLLGLMEEVGELAGKFSKAIRKGWIKMELVITPEAPFEKMNELHELITKELGDVMWMTAGLSRVMGLPSEVVAGVNLEKLQARKSNGTIEGSGDGVTKEERS